MSKLLLVFLAAFVLVLPAVAGDIGDPVDRIVQRETQKVLQANPVYANASPEEKKWIAYETRRNIRVVETQKAFGPLQWKVDQKIDECLEITLSKALDPADKRIPQIRSLFKKVMYEHMSIGKGGSALYSVYESADEGGLGESLETLMHDVLSSDTMVTNTDIGVIFDIIAGQTVPPLNGMETSGLQSRFFSTLMSIR